MLKKRLIVKCSICGQKIFYTDKKEFIIKKEKHKLTKKHKEVVKKLKEKGLDHTISEI